MFCRWGKLRQHQVQVRKCGHQKVACQLLYFGRAALRRVGEKLRFCSMASPSLASKFSYISGWVLAPSDPPQRALLHHAFCACCDFSLKYSPIPSLTANVHSPIAHSSPEAAGPPVWLHCQALPQRLDTQWHLCVLMYLALPPPPTKTYMEHLEDWILFNSSLCFQDGSHSQAQNRCSLNACWRPKSMNQCRHRVMGEKRWHLQPHGTLKNVRGRNEKEAAHSAFWLAFSQGLCLLSWSKECKHSDSFHW